MILNEKSLQLSSKRAALGGDLSGFLSYRIFGSSQVLRGWFVLRNPILYAFKGPDDNSPNAMIVLAGLQVERSESDPTGYEWIKLKNIDNPSSNWSIALHAEFKDETTNWFSYFSQHLPCVQNEEIQVDNREAILTSYKDLFTAEVRWHILKRNKEIEANDDHGLKNKYTTTTTGYNTVFKGKGDNKGSGGIHRRPGIIFQNPVPLQKQIEDELVLAEDSPQFQVALDQLMQEADSARQQRKKILESATNYLRASHFIHSTANEFMDVLTKYAPHSSTNTYLFVKDYDDVVKRFVEAFREQLVLDKVKITQFEEAFVKPMRHFIDVDIKEAKTDKQRLDRARERYKSVLSAYLQLSKETNKTKLDEAEAQLQTAENGFLALRVRSVVQLQDIDHRNTFDFLDQLTTWMYQVQAYHHCGLQLAEDAESFVACTSKYLSVSRANINANKKRSLELLSERRNTINSITFSNKQPKHFDSQGWIHREGYLLKRSSNMRKDWKQRWFILDGSGNGKLFYRSIKQANQNHDQQRSIDLTLSTVRIPSTIGKRFCFEIVSMSPPRSYFLQAANQGEMDEWISAIQHNTGVCLGVGNIGASENQSDDLSETHERLLLLRTIAGNNKCADCNAADPDWVSLNLVVLLCIECAGIHRGMGVHISKMRSLTLDAIDDSSLKLLSRIGNKYANSVWEARENATTLVKPTPESSRSEKEVWIRSKYEKKLFLSIQPEDSTDKNLCEAASSGDLHSVFQYLCSGANPTTAIRESPYQWNALHCAALGGHLLTIELLINNGGLIDLVDFSGNTALHLAMKENKMEIVQYLINKKADQHIKNVAGLTASQVNNHISSSSTPVFNPINNNVSKKLSEGELNLLTNNHYVIAKYEYDAEAGDIRLQVGDRIRVLKTDSSGWWQGEVNGQRGLFPANYTDAPDPFVL